MQSRRAHSQRFSIRREWPFFAAALLVGAIAAIFHEPWRDEAQTVLVGRLPLGEIFHVARIEGVPPGIFLIMKVVGGAFGNLSLAVLAGAGYAVLLRGIFHLTRALTSARAAWMTTGLLALSYPCLFEGGLVARQYGLAHGIALTGWAASLAYARARRGHLAPLLFAATACGLLNLHASLLVASAIAVAVGVRAVRVRSFAPLVQGLACAPGPLLALVFALPHAERSMHMNESAGLLDVRFVSVARVWRRAFFQAEGTWMLPEWPSASLVDGLELPTFAGMAALVLFVLVRRDRKAALFGLGWALASAALTYTFVTRTGAHYRHLVFIALPAAAALVAVALQLARTRSALGLPALGLLVPWVLLLNGLGLGTLAEDVQKPFASARSQATVFPPGAQLVASTGAPIAILYYRPDLVFRAATNGGRPMRHLLPDRTFFTQVEGTTLAKQACGDTHLGRIWTSDLYVYQECATGLIAGQGRVEAWTWYVLDCGCVAAR